MAAVEFGSDVNGYVLLGPSRFHCLAVGDGADEIAAEADEALNRSIKDPFAGINSGQSRVPWRLKFKLFSQLLERNKLRLFRNADGTLPLHVGVTADRCDPRSLAAHMTAKQQQV